MSKYALLIGCNYKNIPYCALNGCINDIIHMYDVLTKKMGYLPSNIIMLRDDSPDPNLHPTKANILNQLYNLIIKSNNAKEIWFHFSGHGSKVFDRNRDEVSGYDSCIVPMDFMSSGFIIDDVLFAYFNKFKCPTMILTDSCFSGTVCDLPYSIEHLYNNTYKYTKNNRYTMTNPKVVMISGSKDNQTSIDAYDYQTQEFEGAFTDAFLRTLEKYSYNASLNTIYIGTCNCLKSDGYSQKPILSSSVSKPSWTFAANANNILNTNVQTLMQPTKTPVYTNPSKSMIFM